jgi:hydrogenase-4 membrane subunit HyfE
VGIIATFLQPVYVNYAGVVRTGLHFIWMQVISLLLVIIAFYIEVSKTSYILIIVGISLSRLELRGFDLCQTQIMQE